MKSFWHDKRQVVSCESPVAFQAYPDPQHHLLNPRCLRYQHVQIEIKSVNPLIQARFVIPGCLETTPGVVIFRTTHVWGQNVPNPSPNGKSQENMLLAYCRTCASFPIGPFPKGYQHCKIKRPSSVYLRFDTVCVCSLHGLGVYAVQRCDPISRWTGTCRITYSLESFIRSLYMVTSYEQAGVAFVSALHTAVCIRYHMIVSTWQTSGVCAWYSVLLYVCVYTSVRVCILSYMHPSYPLFCCFARHYSLNGVRCGVSSEHDYIHTHAIYMLSQNI